MLLIFSLLFHSFLSLSLTQTTYYACTFDDQETFNNPSICGNIFYEADEDLAFLLTTFGSFKNGTQAKVVTDITSICKQLN
jgi:hypothetical protein